MLTPDLVALEMQARRMRAIEMQRIQGIALERLAQYGRSLAASLHTGVAEIGSLLRPLFHSHHRADRIRHCD